MHVGGRRYAFTLASDAAGDATLPELDDVTAGRRETVGDVRYDVRYTDATGALTVGLCRRGVPLLAVERLLAEARRRRPPAAAVVVDPAFGDTLAALAARLPVWVADTPPNRAAAERLRATRAAVGGATAGVHEVTTFQVDPASGPAAWCAAVLPAIMDHHGGDGPHPRAGLLEVIGVLPEPELVGALAAHGFAHIAPAEAGFCAGVV